MLSFVVAEYKYCSYELYKNIKNHFENTKRFYWWAKVQVVHGKCLWGHIQGINGDSQQKQRLIKPSIKKERAKGGFQCEFEDKFYYLSLLNREPKFYSNL